MVAPPTTTTTDDLTVKETSGKRKHNFEESAAKKPEMSERDATIELMNKEALRGSTLNWEY